MTPEDIRKCKKNGYCWASFTDYPHKINITGKSAVLRMLSKVCFHPTRAAAQAAIDERNRLARVEEYYKSMEPITPEQAKDLRDGDEFFYLQDGGGAPRYHVMRDKLDRRPDITKWKCFTEGRAYWTRDAADAALAKQKSVESHETPVGETQPSLNLTGETQDKEPVKWAERAIGEIVRMEDETCCHFSVPLQAPADDYGTGPARAWKTWDVWCGKKCGTKLGEYDCAIRARHITPEWKEWKERKSAQAKRESVAPSKTPVGETQVPKPTTVRGWLETIPDPEIRAAAIKACAKDSAEKECVCLHAAIDSAVSPQMMPEGRDFWAQCICAAMSGTPLPAYPPKVSIGYVEPEKWQGEPARRIVAKEPALEQHSSSSYCARLRERLALKITSELRNIQFTGDSFTVLRNLYHALDEIENALK